MNDFPPIGAAALDNLTPFFQNYCSNQHVPGCAFGVVFGGQVVYSAGVGALNPNGEQPADPAAVYRIASMTKSFTALAILMLRDEGKLRLEAPAADYAPELRRLVYPTRDSAPISVRQLLTMSAGWPEDNAWGDRQLWRSDEELAALLQPGVSFANPPGITFEYSNYAYMVLGRVITHVSGMGALDFINRRILQPLGMNDTVWNEADVDSRRLAKGYLWQEGEWVEEARLPSGGDVAAFGGLYSSVMDMARWIALQLSAWPARDEDDDGLVRRATLREMQQPWRLYTPSLPPPSIGRPAVAAAGGYGYGLSITCEGARAGGLLYMVAHGGGLPGYGSYMCWLPDYDLGLVALANTRYAPMRQAATTAIRQLVQQGVQPPRRIAPAAALESARADVNRLLQGWDDILADQLFADNFFLDESRVRWQAQMADLVAAHGALQAEGELQAENALRGSWKLVGASGWVQASLTLTPTVPPRVQELELESVLPPNPILSNALALLLELLAKPSQRAVNKLFAAERDPQPDRHTIYDRVRLVAVLCGECELGEILAGDGESWVRLRIAGAKAAVEAALSFDTNSRKFTSATFQQVR